MSPDPFDILLATYNDFKNDFRALRYEHDNLTKKISSISGQLKILYILLSPLIIKTLLISILEIIEVLR